MLFFLGAARAIDLTVPAKMYPELLVTGGGCRESGGPGGIGPGICTRAGSSAITVRETELTISATTTNVQNRDNMSKPRFVNRGQPLDGVSSY